MCTECAGETKLVTIRNATFQNIQTALENTSRSFDNNVEANRFEQKGKNFFVTLKVKDSHGKGARRGFPNRENAKHMATMKGRAMVQACWHVYGTFFDELFAVNKDIIVVSLGKRITAVAGNWEDSDVGSIMVPLKYSQMCECSNGDGVH
jgi:hypothetical protein